MEGLTAKVFRTFNASKTLQEQLDLLTNREYSLVFVQCMEVVDGGRGWVVIELGCNVDLGHL